MILYVMRHAEAVEASDSLQDEWRYRTGKGRASVEKTSPRIARYGPKTQLTIISPLTRAVQTADSNPANFLWYPLPGENRITSFKKAFPQSEPR